MAYIPNRDADLDVWAKNFADLLTADPARYGLDAADALIVQDQYDIWSAAFTLARNPSTRTKVNVADKDGEKVTLLQIVRNYAGIIRANNGVTDEDKAALGLTIPDPTPTPVPVPGSPPIIAVPLAGAGVHELSIVDSLTPTKKSKPQGVAGMILYRGSSAAGPVAFSACSLFQLITRSDQIVDTSTIPAGHTITYFGQWYNRKGEIGPLSDACSALKF